MHIYKKSKLNKLNLIIYAIISFLIAILVFGFLYNFWGISIIDTSRHISTIHINNVPKTIHKIIVSSGSVEIDNQAKEILNENNKIHPSADDDFTQKYTDICTKYTDICKIVSWNGDLSYKAKYQYQIIIIHLLNKINQYSSQGDNIYQVLYKIVIDTISSGRRGRATSQQINMQTNKISNNIEFHNVLSHELGHIVDLGSIKGTNIQKNKIYTEFGEAVFAIDDPSINFYQISWSNENTRYSDSSYKDFVSGYGMSDPFEDFAESHNMYLNQNKIFAKMSNNNDKIKQKYNYFDNIYKSQYIFDGKYNAKLWNDTSYRPRDSTKLGK